MGLWNSLAGIVSVEINSAASADLLTAINHSGIVLFDVVQVNDLTIAGKVYRFDYQSLKSLLDRRGEDMTVVGKYGLFWTVANLRKRPVLIVGILILFLLSLYLPTRILFIKVEGNFNVPTQQIVDEASKNGIYFGASRRQIRSEKIKNELLSAIPALQWVGVNTNGCVAVISLKERTQIPTQQNDQAIGSVIARCDGIIQQMTVTRGNPLCSVGQAVYENQVLVSGYTDCGTIVKATRAEAEIHAQTFHKIYVKTPTISSERAFAEHSEVHFSLRIGKKLIKLYKDSGISDSRCVKMYTEYELKLPGGFHLPVALIKEEWKYCSVTNSSDPNQDLDWLSTQTDQYLLDHLLAGKIQDRELTVQEFEGCFSVSGEYICEEMIGQFRNEELAINHGKRN